MKYCRELFCNITATSLHGSFYLFGDVKFHFHSFRRCNVVFCPVNASVTVKVLGRISFHVMAENWKQLKDSLAFSSFLMC